MWDRRRVWSHRASPAGAELVVDSEAFLTGHLAEVLQQRNGYVPEWAWTNLLAHGTEPDLRIDRGAGEEWPSEGESAWRRARSFLAGEVLTAAEAQGSLTEVQSAALVPLELDLAARHDVGRWSPNEWVSHVEAVLGAYRRIHPT